jgi:hypothetical protein
MEITGKLLEKLQQQTGQGKNGAWVKQEFIVETQDQYPKKVIIQLWGDKTRDLNAIEIGETIKASINLESREFNGRWYTDVKAWKIEKSGSQSSAKSSETPPMPNSDELPSFIPEIDGAEEFNDLPF